MIFSVVYMYCISDFEKLQKKALKWIFKEENMHYNDETYIKNAVRLT